MNEFFNTILLVSVFTGLVIIYFFSKNIIDKRKVKKTEFEKRQKTIAKQVRKNNKNFFELLNKLKVNEIFWFEVSRDDNPVRMFIQKIPLKDEIAISLSIDISDTSNDRNNVSKRKDNDFTESRLTIPFQGQEEIGHIFKKHFNTSEGAKLKFKY